MIAYNLIVRKGGIHESFMEIQIGTTVIGLLCAPIRGFVRAANDIGLHQVLEKANPAEHEILVMLYKEFKDELLGTKNAS